jgi:hypothetical protein
MADFFQGLLRGVGGALGAAEKGLIRIDAGNVKIREAEEKRKERLGRKEEAQTQRDFLRSERIASQTFADKQREKSDLSALERITRTGEVTSRTQQEIAGGTRIELQEALANINAAHTNDRDILLDGFNSTNREDMQAFQAGQSKLTRAHQSAEAILVKKHQTSIQELKASQTIEQMKEAQKNYVTNADQSLLHSQQLEDYVLNARDAFSKLEEKRIAAQNVLDDARAYQYTAKGAELKFGYTVKELEKRVELAITAEGRANTEWGRRVKITQKAEIDKLERIAKLEDTYKEKWSKIESAAARDAQTKKDAVAFAKAVYDNSYASLKQLEKIRAELDKEDENYAANAKQLDKYIKQYHKEIVKPAQTRYSRYSGIEVLFPGSYEMNTSNESPERQAIEADAERTVAVVESIYELGGRDSTQSRYLPERVRAAIANGTIDDEDLSGDVAALRASFLGSDSLGSPEAENAYLLQAHPKIFQGPNGEYTEANLKPMIVGALRTIAEQGDIFRTAQPRIQEQGGPLTGIDTTAPGETMPFTTPAEGPPGSATPEIAADVSPTAIRESDEDLGIAQLTLEQANKEIEAIQLMERYVRAGQPMPGRESKPDINERKRYMIRLNKLMDHTRRLNEESQETGMINETQERGLIAQAGDAAAELATTIGGAVLPAMAQASDQPPALPEKGVVDGTDVYIWSVTDLGGETVNPDESNVMQSPGFKLQNPLSIKFTQKNDWEGSLRNAQTSPLTFDDDSEFERFESPQMGYRAAAIIVDKYRQRGNTTAEGIITEWLGGNLQNGVPVPQEEGDLEEYLNVVSQVTGGEIQPDTEINTSDTLKKLFLGMSVMEMGGVVYDQPLSLIEEGIYMSERWNDDAVGTPTLGSGEIPRLPTGPETQFTGGINNYPHDGLIGRY